MSEENVEAVLRLYGAFNEGNKDALLEEWAIDAEWRPAVFGGGSLEGVVYRGHEGMSEFLEVQGETWESAAADVVTIQDLGDRILAEVRLNAIGRASGIAVEQTTWLVIEMRAGKVADARAYTTKEEALRAAGLGE